MALKIISASRRTDIPTFYGKWFMNRIEAGYVQYRNPFNQKLHLASLKPEDVFCFVFWSKNFKPFLKYLPQLEKKGYCFYFHYTITGSHRIFNEHVPAWEESVKTFQFLSKCYGPEKIIWRFDPIVISDLTPSEYYIELFKKICQSLESYTDKCMISFVSYYGKVQRNFRLQSQKKQILFYELFSEEKKALAEKLADTAAGCGIQLEACCSDFLVGKKIKKARCIDADLLSRFFSQKEVFKKRKPTRQECGCSESVDIGGYNTCPHGCVYCYANANPYNPLDYYKSFSSESVFL
jgi:hypothetical protein